MPENAGESSPVQPKAEQHSREASLDSISSQGPEQDGELETPTSPTTVNPPVQKRKGGRKPIYATSEERKQRNRQAQAAFRERRTEYIKQLETTIKQQDETLQNLQQNHRQAADECLMLRYKNSLLERILLEKGINVKEELKKKEIPLTGKPPPSLPQPTPFQRPLGRPASRPGSGHQPILHKGGNIGIVAHSSQLPPVNDSSAGSSVNPRSPNYGMPPPSGFKPQPLHIHPTIRAAAPSVSSPTSATVLQSIAPSPTQPASAGHRQNHWPSPFQTHNLQLEQEYDAPADMMDEETEDHPSGPGPYPQQYTEQFQHDGQQHYPAPHGDTRGNPHSLPNFEHMGAQYMDPFNNLIDPFELDASMRFPTPYNFNESSMRK